MNGRDSWAVVKDCLTVQVEAGRAATAENYSEVKIPKEHQNRGGCAMDKDLQVLRHNLEFAVQRSDAESIKPWFARHLLAPLGYAGWENFQTTTQRAMESPKPIFPNAPSTLRGHHSWKPFVIFKP
jgi:hypothetical protein